jgi:ADP-heptose:LPS heptosyltransferase
MEQEPNLIPAKALDEYWADISRGYDKVINLSETLECKFLFVPDRQDSGYYYPIEQRRERSGNTSYYDYVLNHAGYFDIVSPRPELFPTKIEEAMGQYFRAKYRHNFIILWALAGSSLHKCYPFGEQVALEFLNRHKDAITITVGDDLCRLIEWDHPRAEKKSAVWDIRSSMLVTKHVDLVISPETGILNASGCYATPKIGLLTHSNKTNLCKHFSNDYSMQAEIDCAPCHRMIYPHNAEKDCPKLDLGGGSWLCACAGAFDPNKLLQRMENIYAAWKAKKRSVRLIQPQQAVHDFGRLKLGDILQPKRATV